MYECNKMCCLEVKIHPIVWVKSIDTLYYETACGSGSLATAIYIKYKENYNWVKIKQPSGYFINVEFIESEDYLDKAIVSGKIIKE